MSDPVPFYQFIESRSSENRTPAHVRALRSELSGFPEKPKEGESAGNACHSLSFSISPAKTELDLNALTLQLAQLSTEPSKEPELLTAAGKDAAAEEFKTSQENIHNLLKSLYSLSNSSLALKAEEQPDRKSSKKKKEQEAGSTLATARGLFGKSGSEQDDEPEPQRKKSTQQEVPMIPIPLWHRSRHETEYYLNATKRLIEKEYEKNKQGNEASTPPTDATLGNTNSSPSSSNQTTTLKLAGSSSALQDFHQVTHDELLSNFPATPQQDRKSHHKKSFSVDHYLLKKKEPPSPLKSPVAPTRLQELQSCLSILLERQKMLSQSIKEMESLTILNFDAKVLAQQMTLLDFQIFSNLTQSDLESDLWSTTHLSLEEKRRQCPALYAHFDFFNYVAGWTQCSILDENSAQSRSLILQHFLKISYYLHKYASYNMLKAIISGLTTCQIQRLKLTWSLVPSKSKSMLEEYKEMVSESHNYHHLRAILDRHPSPCIPFLGLYLHDLTYYRAAVASGLHASSMTGPLNSLLAFQKSDYASQIPSGVHEPIRYWLLSRIWKNDEALYQLSLLKEPPNTFSSSSSSKKYKS